MKNDFQHTNQTRPVYDYTPTLVSIGCVLLNVALVVYQTKPMSLGLLAVMIRIIIVIWISDLAEKRGKKPLGWVVFGLLFPLLILFIIGFIPCKTRPIINANNGANNNEKDASTLLKKMQPDSAFFNYCIDLIKEKTHEISTTPEEGVNYFERGKLYQTLGNVDLALLDYHKAQKLFELKGENEEAQEVGNKIAELSLKG